MSFEEEVKLEMQAHPCLSKEDAEKIVTNNHKSKLTYQTKEDR